MLKVFNNTDELSQAAAALFTEIAVAAVKETGRFMVALTGGTSPEKLYRLLATDDFKSQVAWDKTYIFWGDERWVPLTDEKSNAKMSFETLLDHVPVPQDHIFPMWADEKPEDFAASYEALLKEKFGEDLPRFDLILLGMGDDGHTASLFPGTEVLHEEIKLVRAYYLEAQHMYRVTLTAPCINAAKNIVFITYGDKKANALHEVLEGEHNPDKYPSQLIRTNQGQVYWFTDEAGAALLS